MTGVEPIAYCAVCGKGLNAGDLMCNHTELEVARMHRDGCACGGEHVGEVTIQADPAFDVFSDEEREELAAGIDEARGKVRGLSIEEIDEITGDDVRYWLGNDFMSPDLLAEKVCSWISAVVAARLAPVEAERTRHYAAFCGSEAEVARLTAERDSRHNAWAAAVKQAHAAEARAAKAEALVEAGLGLADRWQGVVDECKANDPRWILDQTVTTLETALGELRAALGGAK